MQSVVASARLTPLFDQTSLVVANPDSILYVMPDPVRGCFVSICTNIARPAAATKKMARQPVLVR